MQQTTFISLFFIISFSVAQVSIHNSPNIGTKLKYSSRNIALGSPEFTNPDVYNAFDFNDAPVGLLQREKDKFKLGLGFLSADNSGKDNEIDNQNASTSFFLPVLSFNLPGTMASSFYYRIIRDARSSNDQEVDLALRSLGFNIAVGLKSKFFQWSLSGHTIFGQVKDKDNHERLLVSIPQLEVGVGSQVHPLVRVGAHFGASGSFDSLRAETGLIFERQANVSFPNWGLHVDFGDTTRHPLLANFSARIMSDRAFGNYKNQTNNQPARNYSINGFNARSVSYLERQYNPRWTKAYDLRWISMLLLKNKDIEYRPACTIGFLRSTTQRYRHGENSDEKKRDPWSESGICPEGENCTTGENGPCLPGEICYLNDEDSTVHNWSYTAFSFGLGASVLLKQYVSLFTEWAFHSISLNIEDSFMGQNRILVGVEGNLHNIPSWRFPDDVQLFLRSSLAFGAELSNFRSVRSEQFQFFNEYTLSDKDLYSRRAFRPGVGKKINWTTLNFGLGTAFWQGLVSGDFYTSFLFQKNAEFDDRFSGVEFGLRAELRL